MTYYKKKNKKYEIINSQKNCLSGQFTRVNARIDYSNCNTSVVLDQISKSNGLSVILPSINELSCGKSNNNHIAIIVWMYCRWICINSNNIDNIWCNI